ncbi:MAG: hypothetical protein SPL80_00815 [Bacilli bacterium]|nr:hypothetical protein [Bacilli bacterium]
MANRVLAVVLEGDSDRLTFERAFTLLLHDRSPDDSLQVFVFRGDLTINDENGDPIDSNDVLQNLIDFLSRELRTYGLNPKDLLGVIHISDLDAVYCDSERVSYANQRRLTYDLDHELVLTRNVEATLQRNERKRDALTTLMNTQVLEFYYHRLYVVPYRLFYLGINLEHAFYGLVNCSSGEKESLSLDFDESHASTSGIWSAFVQSLPCYGENYEESCRYARMKEYAFKRMTNLRFVETFLDEILIPKREP